MRRLAILFLLPLTATGCIVGTVAETAVDVATIPVKVASAGVDAATTSQSEADEKRGRELRKQDEERGRELRKQDEERGRELRRIAERCRKGRALPTDDCKAVRPR